ncbi:putative dehydrogenase [Naumannella cuiyingiana]|uniref:Putative dehydrogenase n=1 Tax=Naumannella cuiyingiana TaxID=1347891 RepID=A0A7Z0DC29_9ACTN|nr:Gfo/Idh/MocA family oxidoreductase [Naumannella cuiyingiana]NYI72549.1 putative dehydrogenase [Naumannella cuiyingiana]
MTELGTPKRLRVGLIGTGHWARETHAAGLAAAPEVDFAGVWGRNPERATALAADLGVRSYPDLDGLLADVDAVAIAVPPDVQAGLAVRAAEAGRHLLLDKPVALSAADARAVADAVERSGVRALVFFTRLFLPEQRAWLDELAATGGWSGGWLRMISAIDQPGSPYAESTWRRERGALWDLGPHALSTMITVLGDVEELIMNRGVADVVNLLAVHRGGATSVATLSLFSPPAAAGNANGFWGRAGIAEMPPWRTEPSEAFALAARALATGEPHPADLVLGVRITELLEEAERADHR